MSNNRPFMTNFLAAFRAHSAIQKTATSTSTNPSSTSTTPSFTHSSTSPNASSTPRPISKPAQTPSATLTAVQAASQFHPTRQHNTPPYSRSPVGPGNAPLGSPPGKQRRGSDSSSEGFRDSMGADKWYIGGRTAAGEERFYKLGVAKKHRSIDRLSLDRLSI